ncbi:gametocyte-specific factor 1 homolog [Anopheles ziemanni]|nr:gametocyte-specific factor 1 homolog [Anopheles ziemanni]
MQVHLIKCEKQHPHIKLQKCLFNYTHHIKPEEYQEHLRECKDRILVESSRYVTAGEASKPPPVQPVVEEHYTPEEVAAAWGEENWDDMDEKPYDPQKYCRENKIIQKARLMTKSEKRAFYQAESMRHDELAKKEAMASPTKEPQAGSSRKKK